MLDNFKAVRFGFVLSALKTIILPQYKGSTFRGGFGTTFRRIVCTTKKDSCDDCMFKQKCPYSYIFETPPPRDTEIMRRYPHVPHPFVTEPPEEGKHEYMPGESLRFGLVLVGRAIEYLPYFVFTFDELGKKGLGKTRGNFRLDKVFVEIEGKEAIEIFASPEKVLNDQYPIVSANQFSGENLEVPEEVRVRFSTPVRIRYQDSFNHKMDFHILIRNLLRRIGSLDYFHCGGALGSIDYRALIASANGIETVSNHLVWKDWDRFSRRQEQMMNLGGFVGEISYRGNLSPFWSFMRIGEMVHVGKGTSFGLGKFSVILS